MQSGAPQSPRNPTDPPDRLAKEAGNVVHLVMHAVLKGDDSP